jgi:hypothetical protein
MSYVSTVVDFLNTRTTDLPSLSAEDYTAIAEWEKQEIPLGFVLGSLDRRLTDAEAKLVNDTGSISDIRGDIVAEFANWLQERDRSDGD